MFSSSYPQMQHTQGQGGHMVGPVLGGGVRFGSQQASEQGRSLGGRVHWGLVCHKEGLGRGGKCV